MAKPVLAMEKNDIRAAIRRAAGEPMNCAVLTGKDPGIGLFRLDVRKGPKIVLNGLQADFPDGKQPAHGTARVSPEDETVMLMTLNKVPGGTARRILKAIKGSGIKRLEITGEDGSSDSSLDDEPDAADAAGAAAPQAAQAPAAAGLAPDLAMLNERLRTLAGRIKGVLEKAPDRKAELLALAGAAQGGVKAVEAAADPGAKQAAFGQASHALDALEAALGGSGAAQHPASGNGASKAPAPGGERLEQVGAAWAMTRKKVRTDLTALEKALEQEYGQTAAGPQVVTAYRTRVATILATLDGRLDDTLAAAAKAQSPAERAQRAAEAREILKEHAAYVASETLIADLDTNPFVTLELRKTLTGTLSKLSAAMG